MLKKVKKATPDDPDDNGGGLGRRKEGKNGPEGG